MTSRPGPAAQEAVRLLAAVQKWAQDRMGDQHLATGSAECTGCPLCQAVRALRQLQPDTGERLLAAASSFVGAVKAAFQPEPYPTDQASDHKRQHDQVREG